MAIKAKCPECGDWLTAPDHALGKKVRCQRCLSQFTITPHVPTNDNFGLDVLEEEDEPTPAAQAPKRTIRNPNPNVADASRASRPPPDVKAIMAIVGTERKSPEVKHFCTRMPELPEIKRFETSGNYVYYSWRPLGISLSFCDDLLVAAFLYGEQDGFARYQGNLPSRLSFSDTRAEVEAKLGSPDESRARSGALPYWASYQRHGLHITYASTDSEDLNAKIAYVSLSLPSGTLKFRCSCGRSVTAPQSLAGKKAKCPYCGKIVIVPGSPASTPTGPKSESSGQSREESKQPSGSYEVSGVQVETGTSVELRLVKAGILSRENYQRGAGAASLTFAPTMNSVIQCEGTVSCYRCFRKLPFKTLILVGASGGGQQLICEHCEIGFDLSDIPDAANEFKLYLIWIPSLAAPSARHVEISIERLHYYGRSS